MIVAATALNSACLGTGTRRIDASCREMESSIVFEMLKDNPTIPILDVRRPAEISGAEGRLQGGRSIPIDELAKRVSELFRFRDTTVIVVGHDGEEGRRACQLLASRGFQYVIFISDGAEGWFKNRLPAAPAPASP
jgi:rhodanese-related sulfurtransferase